MSAGVRIRIEDVTSIELRAAMAAVGADTATLVSECGEGDQRLRLWQWTGSDGCTGEGIETNAGLLGEENDGYCAARDELYEVRS